VEKVQHFSQFLLILEWMHLQDASDPVFPQTFGNVNVGRDSQQFRDRI